MRKKLLLYGLLAVLLLSMVCVPMVAAAHAKTIVKGNVYAMDYNGYIMGGKPLGKATFDTQSGAWSITTKKTLPDSDYGLYHFGITQSKPVKGIKPGGTEIILIDVGSGDHIDQSGIVSDSNRLSELNQNIANRGVFYLETNFV